MYSVLSSGGIVFILLSRISCLIRISEHNFFGGFGTTLLAAEQSDRINCSMELDPKYCDVIVKRYIEFRESDEGVFLLRGGEKLAYNEIEG